MTKGVTFHPQASSQCSRVFTRSLKSYFSCRWFRLLASSVHIPFRQTPRVTVLLNTAIPPLSLFPCETPAGSLLARERVTDFPCPLPLYLWIPGERPLLWAPDKPHIPTVASTCRSRTATASSLKFRPILMPDGTSLHFQ